MKHILFLLLTIVCGICFWPDKAFSQNSTDKYLTEMPLPATIIADLNGTDSLDVTARQVAAFRILPDWMALITENEMGFKPRSALYNRLFTSYREAEGNITTEVLKGFDPEETKRLGMNSPRALWYSKASKYQYDQAFMDKLLQNYFSDAWQTRYKKLKASSDSLTQAAVNQSSQTITLSPDVVSTQTPPSPKEENGSGLQYLILGVIALALLVGLPYLVFGMRKSLVFEKPVLNIDGREYVIHSLTGTVVNTTKTATTHVHSSGGGYDSQTGHYTAPTVHSTTTIHDQIFLIDKNQKEHVVQLSGWDLPTREGNELTMIWAIKKGKKEGPYIVALNHSTGEKYHMPSRMVKIFAVSWKRWYAIVLLILLILPIPWAMTALAEVRKQVSDFSSPAVAGEHYREQIITYLWAWAFYLTSWLVGFVIAARLGNKRIRAFVDLISMKDYQPGK